MADQDPQPDKFNEGKPNSHQANDPKDERPLANRFAAEEKREKQEKQRQKELEIDPTLPAKMHGNKPSKGAKIDQEIKEEEQELLGKKTGK